MKNAVFTPAETKPVKKAPAPVTETAETPEAQPEE